MRLVIDTNIWVSYLLNKSDSALFKKVDHLISHHTLLYSFDTLFELAEVLTRDKFRKYIDLEDTQAFIEAFVQTGEEVDVKVKLNMCRDPKDNKLLELAVDGQADYLISGDQDLLVLESIKGIPIVTLQNFSAE